MNRLALLLLALPLCASTARAAPPAPVPAPVPALERVGSIALGGEARWDYLLVDPAAHRLYVAHGGETAVVDTRTDKPVGTIADTPGVHGIAVAPELGLGFVSAGKADAVRVFELASLKTVASIAVGGNPDAIVWEPASRRVLAFNGRSHDVSVIDAAARKVVATVPVGGKPEFAQVGADGTVWFNVEDTAELVSFDARAAKVTGRHALAPCDEPTGLAIDDRQRLWSVCGNGLAIATAGDGKRVGQAPVGAGADGVAWLDGLAWSAGGRDGTISVLAETAPGRVETLATIPSARGARTIAADPSTHRLYLPTADVAPAPASEPGARPTAVPGSFHVLVFEHRP